MRSKFADFGLSVSMEDEKNYFRSEKESEKLPVKWMAPESLLDRKFSEFSDVVSHIFELTVTQEFFSFFLVGFWSDLLGGVQLWKSSLPDHQGLRFTVEVKKWIHFESTSECCLL